MPNGDLNFTVDLDDSKAQQKIDKLKNNVEKATNEFEKQRRVVEGLAAELEMFQKAAKLHPEDSGIKEGVNEFSQKLKDAQIKLDNLGVKVRSENTKLDEALNPKSLDEVPRKISNISKSTESVSQSGQRAASAFGKFGKRVMGLIKSALIFSVITKACTLLRDHIAGIIGTNREFASSLAQIKGNLQVAFMPIYQAILPALQALANGIAVVTAYLAKFVNVLFGKTVASSKAAANAMNKQAAAMKKTGKETKKAAKETEKATLAFDELNILKNNKNSDSGGTEVKPIQTTDISASTLSSELKKALTEIAAMASGFLFAIGLILLFSGHIGIGLLLTATGALMMYGAATAQWQNPGNEIQTQLLIVEGIVYGAALALGALLAFSGANIGLGIALMASGALGLAQKVSDTLAEGGVIPEKISEYINTITVIASGALLALGLILLFTGNIGLGIGLMISGIVASLGIVEAAITEGEISEKTADALNTIGTMVGSAFLALGAVLAFSGANLPLGIALLSIGAAVIVAAIALNWESLSTETKNRIYEVSAYAAGALLALGVVLAFSGINFPLGLALISAGAILLVAMVAPNWNELPNETKNRISAISLIATGALLVLGIILLCTGVNIPLGIALLVAGAAGLVTVAKLNKDKIVDWIKDLWGKISDYWRNNIAVWFTKQKWVELAGKIGDGLKSGFKTAVNGLASILENSVNAIVRQLNKISFTAPDWVPGVGGKTVGFNLEEISIPRLAKGTVVPRSAPFLAMLGDNTHETEVVSPLSTMKQALIEAMQEGGGQNINITFKGSIGQLIRMLQPEIERENRRRGTSLVTGGAY